jgi:hypothetical protein
VLHGEVQQRHLSIISSCFVLKEILCSCIPFLYQKVCEIASVDKWCLLWERRILMYWLYTESWDSWWHALESSILLDFQLAARATVYPTSERTVTLHIIPPEVRFWASLELLSSTCIMFNVTHTNLDLSDYLESPLSTKYGTCFVQFWVSFQHSSRTQDLPCFHCNYKNCKECSSVNSSSSSWRKEKIHSSIYLWTKNFALVPKHNFCQIWAHASGEYFASVLLLSWSDFGVALFPHHVCFKDSTP